MIQVELAVQGEMPAIFIAGVTWVSVGKRKSMLTAVTYRSTRSLACVFVCLKHRALGLLIMHGSAPSASASRHSSECKK